MTHKKPNFIYQFDNKKYSKEEQKYLFYEFISCLMKLEAKQQAQNAKTKKEQKQIENKFMNFGSNIIKEFQNDLSNK